MCPFYMAAIIFFGHSCRSCWRRHVGFILLPVHTRPSHAAPLPRVALLSCGQIPHCSPQHQYVHYGLWRVIAGSCLLAVHLATKPLLPHKIAPPPTTTIPQSPLPAPRLPTSDCVLIVFWFYNSLSSPSFLCRHKKGRARKRQCQGKEDPVFHTCDTSTPPPPRARSWRAGWTTSHLATCQHSAKVARELQGDSKWKYFVTNTWRGSQGSISTISTGVTWPCIPLRFAYSGLLSAFCEL
jgi:hypothetical protein